jgi:transposase
MPMISLSLLMKGFIMARHRLTDEQWDLICDLFASTATTGRPPRDRRQVFDGILWILNTGCAWRDLPGEFGPWNTVWTVFDTWNHNGTLAKALSRLQGQAQIDPDLWCIDGTVVRAHKCSAGGGKKGMPTSPTITRWAAAVAV